MRESYLLAFLLALLPSLLLLRQWRPPKLGFLGIAGTTIALLAMTGPYMLAADSGRYIYLFAIHTFAFLSITGIKPTSGDVAVSKWDLAKLGLVAVYATAWGMAFYSNTRGLGPGPLLRFLGLT